MESRRSSSTAASRPDDVLAAAPRRDRDASDRLAGVDVLRGAVMVLMALDHVRDYFGDIRVDPTDLSVASTGLFFTRWVTHFCAPVFVLLAGIGIRLRRDRRGVAGLSRHLLTRGLWLLLLEMTVVTLSWTLSIELGVWFFQVIAVIGVAMIVMAALVHVPPTVVLAIGVAASAFHPLLVGVGEPLAGAAATLWTFAYGGQAFVPVPGLGTVVVVYSCIPWLGVMALGYGLAPLLVAAPATRRTALLALGTAVLAAFVVLRALGLGGEPSPWDGATLASFLNGTKYPPSPLYLAMTLGPALLFLAVADGVRGATARVLATFGRVPLFYYIVHLPLIHLAAIGWYALRHGEPVSPMQAAFRGAFPSWFGGGGLLQVYLAWALVVAALYVPCSRYAAVRRERRWWWTRWV